MTWGVRSYLVECYSPGVRRADVESAARRAAAVSEELRHSGTPVDYTGAILLPGDEVVLHLFSSESEQGVREASERAAIAFERILETVQISDGPLTVNGSGPGGESDASSP